jgi:hypothetical protein
MRRKEMARSVEASATHADGGHYGEFASSGLAGAICGGSGAVRANDIFGSSSGCGD